MNPCTDDIVIPKGLRMNHHPEELIIQKPGEADGGANKIVIPYGTDLINLANKLFTLESGSGSGPGSEEGGSSYTPAIPEDLNTFSLNEPNSSPDNSLFNYYRNADNSKLGVLVRTNNNSKKLFSIEKNSNKIQIGTNSAFVGDVNIGRSQLTLYGKINIYFYNFYENRGMQLTYNEDYIEFANNLSHKVMKLPYGTDLTNFEIRLTTLESGGNYEYVINEIKVINPYLGIDDCVDLHTDKEPKDIIREKNEKFFQYYRTIDGNNNLSGFGVKVKTYENTYKGDLIQIDKKNNTLHLGYEEKLEDFPYHFKTGIIL
jgi:hypothetical protein